MDTEYYKKNKNSFKKADIDLTKLEKLQRDLYSKHANFDVDIRQNLRKKEYDINNKNWDIDEKPKDSKKNGFKSFLFYFILLISVIFFVGSVSYAYLSFVSGKRDVLVDNIDIKIIGPVSVSGGETLDLEVLIQNHNEVVLRDADLIIKYPEGARTIDLMNELTLTRISIGDIEANHVLKESVDMAFLGDQGEVKDIIFEIEYKLDGSANFFRKSKELGIVLSDSPIRILVEGVENVSSGQSFDLDVVVTSNSRKNIDTLILKVDYPFGFKFNSSTIDPTKENNLWIFNDVKPGDLINFKINGILTAQNNEQRVFRFMTGVPDNDNTDEIAIELHNFAKSVLTERPFVGVSFDFKEYFALKENTVVLENKSRFPVDISIYNNTNDIIRDLKLVIDVEGNMFIENEIRLRDGFYDSVKNQIIIDRFTSPSMEQINPRNTVSFQVDMVLYDLFKIPDINPEASFSIYLTGKRISENEVEENIDEKDFVKINILSPTKINSYTYYTIGPFANTGPVPPRVEQETTYAVSFDLVNISNKLKDAKITASIPRGVYWKNNFSPAPENVYYDEANRLFVWDIGEINPGVGALKSDRQIFVNFGVIPNANQIGSKVIILDDVIFEATDTLSNEKISKRLEKITSDIDESTWGPDSGNVTR